MSHLLRTAAAVVLLTAGCAGAVAAQDDFTVGRIVDMEPNHGYVVVQFANGRMNVTMDKRNMGQYIVGDEIRIDSFGRPLPKVEAPRRPPSTR
jgi:hypothetical protein